MAKFDFVMVGTEQRLGKAFDIAWTKYPAKKAHAAILKAVYEILDEHWHTSGSVIELERVLKIWESCEDMNNPHVMMFSIIYKAQDRLLEDIRTEAEFQLTGEEFV